MTVRPHRPSTHWPRHLCSHAPLAAVAPRTQALCHRTLPDPCTTTWRMLCRPRLTPSYNGCSSGEHCKFLLCLHIRVLGMAGCVGGFGALGVGFTGLGACCARLRCAVEAWETLAPHTMSNASLLLPRRGHLIVFAYPRIVRILSPPLLSVVRFHCASMLCWVLHSLPFPPGVAVGIQIPLPLWVNTNPALSCASHWGRDTLT